MWLLMISSTFDKSPALSHSTDAGKRQRRLDADTDMICSEESRASILQSNKGMNELIGR